MPNQDLHNNVNATNAFAVKVFDDNDVVTNGAIIYNSSFRSIEFVLIAGIISDGDWTPTLQEGDESDLSDATIVSSDFILGDLTESVLTTSNQVKRFGYNGKKKYVRLRITSANTATGTIAAVAIQEAATHAPVPNN